MRQAVIPSQYLQIALDLATRIARGELPEGSRIYGRSVMAPEYGVSPETIRRALRLLHMSSRPETVLTALLCLARMERGNIVNVTEGVRYGLSPEDIEQFLKY